MALLLTSHSVHAATLNTLYRHITIPHSRIFRKFLQTIRQYPTLASNVRRIDFSHFNPSTIFSTANERAQTKNLTSETLAQCLEFTQSLQEFLAQEYIDDDLSPEVLRRLLFGMPQLQAIDFCGCSSIKFRSSFNTVLHESEWPEHMSISRISFHKCISLPSAIYEALLPRLGQLTHLDVAGTRITDKALQAIPTTARLTHLNLTNCKELSSEVVIKFITTHPAVTVSLQFLSLASDSSHLLLGKDDVVTLLQKLPLTLRSLNLKGSRMDPSHISHIIPLTQRLEELAVGYGLNSNDIYQIFRSEQDGWLVHNLRYLDVSDIDIVIGAASTFLLPHSAPLRVVEVRERVYEKAAKMKQSLERAGWTPKEFGNRYWIVRMNADGTTNDDGGRSWKMGAENWGMRKVPVAIAEVGGMYGSFMFGRRL